MKPTILRRAASAMGVAALVLGSIVLGTTSAHAGSNTNDCYEDPTIGTLVDAQTAGAWWYEICVNTSVVGEGETTNKVDAFDGFGYIAVAGTPALVGAVPTSYGYVGSDYVVEFTDAGFDLGGGDLVDIVVTQTFSGTFVSWEVNFFDAGTTTPRPGILFSINGDLGCDGDCAFTASGNQMMTYGDFNDPVILWEIDSSSFSWIASDSNDDVSAQMESDGVLTMALVDYGCGATDVLTYAASILTGLGGLAAQFGASLQEPGTVDCVTVGGPLQITQGQPFDYVVPLTLLTPPWDWTGGGSVSDSYGQLDFVDYESLNAFDAGVEPGMRIFGTAPSSPGTYNWPVYVEDDEGLYSRGFLTINVVAPALAATGVDTTVLLVAGLGATVLGGLALALVRRRRLTQD